MMAFSGVRSSWLILARNRVLAREADKAASRASTKRILVILAFGNVAGHRHDIGGLAQAHLGRTAADFRPDKVTVAMAQADFGRTGVADDSWIPSAPPAPRPDPRDAPGSCITAPVSSSGIRPSKRRGGRAGETDTAVGGMAGDHVHGVVGQEAIHGRALRRRRRRRRAAGPGRRRRSAPPASRPPARSRHRPPTAAR